MCLNQELKQKLSGVDAAGQSRGQCHRPRPDHSRQVSSSVQGKFRNHDSFRCYWITAYDAAYRAGVLGRC